jgi:hypothetical protein
LEQELKQKVDQIKKEQIKQSDEVRQKLLGSEESQKEM